MSEHDKSLHTGFIVPPPPPPPGSLTKLGDCMNRYWQQKKAMAPGCEPAAVRTMMEALHPRVLGQSLAGAGGGGFLFILTRDVQQEQNVRQVLNSTQVRDRLKTSGVKILDRIKLLSF